MIQPIHQDLTLYLSLADLEPSGVRCFLDGLRELSLARRDQPDAAPFGAISLAVHCFWPEELDDPSDAYNISLGE